MYVARAPCTTGLQCANDSDFPLIPLVFDVVFQFNYTYDRMIEFLCVCIDARTRYVHEQCACLLFFLDGRPSHTVTWFP